MKKLFFLSLIVMNVFTIYSQTKGVIFDDNNLPINQVNIYLSDQNILLYSNEKGEFISKSDIPNNSYINFYKNGYSTKVIRYVSNMSLDIILNKLHISLDEVGISRSYNKLGNSMLTSVEKKSVSDIFSYSTSMIEVFLMHQELMLFHLELVFRN